MPKRYIVEPRPNGFGYQVADTHAFSDQRRIMTAPDMDGQPLTREYAQITARWLNEGWEALNRHPDGTWMVRLGKWWRRLFRRS